MYQKLSNSRYFYQKFRNFWKKNWRKPEFSKKNSNFFLHYQKLQNFRYCTRNFEIFDNVKQKLFENFDFFFKIPVFFIFFSRKFSFLPKISGQKWNFQNVKKFHLFQFFFKNNFGIKKLGGLGLSWGWQEEFSKN